MVQCFPPCLFIKGWNTCSSLLNTSLPPTFRLCSRLRCLKREKPKRKREKRRINFGFGNGESREEGLGDLQRGWDFGEHCFPFGKAGLQVRLTLFLLIWFPEISFMWTIGFCFFWIIRLVLMGNESALRKIAEEIMGSIKGAAPVEVVGMDMEEEKESVFDEAVGRATMWLGKLDALVHCYSYEGLSKTPAELQRTPMYYCST